MKKNIKWWMIPLGIVLAVSIATAAFWPSMKVYLAPKTVLAAALTDAFEALEKRTANNPFLLLAGAIDMDNGNDISMTLTTDNKLLGTVQYDMDIQAKWYPRQLMACGQVHSQGKGMDLSVYMDSDFAAISSAGLLQGNFYGLTYDTFSQDIRANQLLSLVIGESTLQDWETKVHRLQDFMRASFSIPEFSKEDFKQLLVAIMALRPEIEKETISENGASKAFAVISFKTTGQAILTGLRYLKLDMQVPLDPKETVEISFWLHEETLRRIEVESSEREVKLNLGPDPASDDLLLSYEEGETSQTICIHTQQKDANYQETITLSGDTSMELMYHWNSSSGALELRKNQEGESKSISANLIPTDSGIRLETRDFEGLMHLFFETKDTADSTCVLFVRNGTDIITPNYKNFKDWSLEDLITLLGGVGSLLGLKIA